jgi:hypothetical protein
LISSRISTVLTNDLLLDLHYLSIALAIVIPLYYWYVRKDRQSAVLRVARGIRALNGLLYLAAFFYAAEFFWDEYLVPSIPFLLALLIISYLLVRRWAPKQGNVLVASA